MEDPHRLPPLEWLRVFEAAARCGSFTAAAAELNLTQAAVSQRVRNLEMRLGASLFDRLPRGVRLTVEGEAYAPHVQAALEMLHRSTSDLFSPPRRTVTIAATASLIQLWIAPRLGGLVSAFPDLQLTFVTVHRAADLDAASAELDIRFGKGDWPGRQVRKLFDERLAPVATPLALEGSVDDWRRLPQIAVSGPRHGWNDWAAAAGSAPPRSRVLRFDTFAQARAAALAGAGVLLGSLDLLAVDLGAGHLIRLNAPEVRMTSGYWLSWPERSHTFRGRPAIIELLSRSG